VHRVAEALAEQRGKIDANDIATNDTLKRLQADVVQVEKKLQDLEVSLASSSPHDLSSRLSTIEQTVQDLGTAQKVRDAKEKLLKALLTLGGGAGGAGIIEALQRFW
jgi:hypothetical protein